MKAGILKIGALLTVFGAVGISLAFYATGLLEGQGPTELVLELDYYGHWSLNITENGDLRSFTGFGRCIKGLVSKNPGKWAITIAAQKNDESSGTLSLKLKNKDGTVVAKDYALGPYGKAEVVYRE